MRTVVLFSLTCFLSSPASGQQIRDTKGDLVRVGPVSTKDFVVFRLSDMTLENARTIPVRLRVDNPGISYPFASILSPRTCTRQGSSSNYDCEAPLPLETVSSLNVPGRHDLYAFTFDGYCCESIPSDPWTLTTPATK